MLHAAPWERSMAPDLRDYTEYQSTEYWRHSRAKSNPGGLQRFQAKDPLAEREMKQGPPDSI